MTNTQWGRFNARAGQTIRDLGGEQAIEITNGTATYDGIGEGDSYSYPADKTAILDAETMAPSAVDAIDDGGTESELDQVAFVAPLVGSKTYTKDTTIAADEVLTFDTVTVDAGVTLTVEGRLQTNTLTVNGTVVDNGVVAVYNGLYDSITPYGESNPPTRVTVPENGVTFEIQNVYEQGDGYTRLDMTEIDG